MSQQSRRKLLLLVGKFLQQHLPVDANRPCWQPPRMANSRSWRSQQSCLFRGRGSLGLANGKIFPESKKFLLFLIWDFHFLFSLKLVWILKLTWARKVLVVVPYRLSRLLQRNKHIKQAKIFAFLSYFPRPDLLLTDSHLSATCGTCERPLYQVRQKIYKK